MAEDPSKGQPESDSRSGKSDLRPGRGVLLLRTVLPLVALATGLAVTLWLMKTSPEAKPRPKTRNAALVKVEPVTFAPQTVRIVGMGTVVPSQDVTLKPQVSGEIIALGAEFLPGGFFRRGETLLQIDDTDYRLAVEQLGSEVAQVEAELQLEQGNQLVALKEFELLGESVSEEERRLMLRQPQLEKLKADLAAARARLEQSRINLARTEIRAPFNAQVFSRQVDLGSRVTSSSELARLVGTDSYWIEVSVPVRQLRWIDIPRSEQERGARARIYDRAAWGEQGFREGRVVRLAAAIEEQGRMARLLVEVDDPLARSEAHAGQPPLLLNSYVRIEIDGRQLEATAAIPRDLLRDGETLWILDGENRLDIRQVEIAFRGETEVFVTSGVSEGERLIVSNLATPVDGMPLRLPADTQPPAAGSPAAEAAAEQ